MGLPGGHAECGSTTGVLSKLLRSWVEGPNIGEERLHQPTRDNGGDNTPLVLKIGEPL